MDFTQSLQPIDGGFPYLLSIRDLASHDPLAWCPVRGQTAADVLPVLHELFALYGPPLVLKHDNGSTFLAGVTHQPCSTRSSPHASLRPASRNTTGPWNAPTAS